MTIAFTCPSCLADLRLNDRYAGECIKCPRCQGLMVVPDEVADEVVDDLAALATPTEPLREPPVDDWQAHLRSSPAAGTGSPGMKSEAPSTERVKFFCKNCGSKMSAATSAAGRPVTCPRCKTRQQIPGRGNADTTNARADETPTRSLVVPHLTGNPRAMVSNSDSLIDALDDVDLAEARAPVASPFLTGYSTAARRSERPPNWLFSWSTILAAAGTLLGLLLVWAAMSAPALYRDHVQPYFEKHIVAQADADPARQALRIGFELVDLTDKLTESLRQTHDVESAHTQMPIYIADLLHICELEQSVQKLRTQHTDAPATQEQEMELTELKRRMAHSQAQLRIESARCEKIPGVPLAMANALSEALSRDTTGNLVESLKASPQGRAFLAFSGHSARQGKQPADTPPLPTAPQSPATPPPPLESSARVVADNVDRHAVSPAPPDALPSRHGSTPDDSTSNAPAEQPIASPADAAAAGQLIASLLHLSELEKVLLARSQEITDVSSLRTKAIAWAAAAHIWQRQEADVEKMAGQEFVGDDAQRYADAKETTDRQRGQLFAEFERLEKLGALPQLNARLVRLGGKALGSGSIANDDDSGSKKPLKRSSPRALKRVTTP